ncbi:mitochondrial carrier domain-containing protein [Lactifluus subvellereus]|nr:mitochondrial carrier domain-containing protein [Lactifluus subvellereus]
MSQPPTHFWSYTAALDPTLDFLAGTVAGVSGLVVGFPFDTVKYRFQNPSPTARYHSTFHALTTITREERLHGLYKGISSPLATAPLLNGMLFATYRFLMKLQTRLDHDHDPEGGSQDEAPTLVQVFNAAAGCGLATTILTTPIELIKIQQQKQQQHLPAHEVARIPPARTVGLQIFRAGGTRLLYRGLTPTILRDVGGYGLYFFGYEGTLRLFAPPPAPPDEATATPPAPAPAHRWAPLLLAGGVAGILGWIVTFPFDVLKTRMQAEDIPGTGTGTSTGSAAPHPHPHRPPFPLGTWRTARTMYAEPDGGSRIFWRGLTPTIIRAVPVNMAVFGTFEAVVWAFS